jgi:hypothetical protein
MLTAQKFLCILCCEKALLLACCCCFVCVVKLKASASSEKRADSLRVTSFFLPFSLLFRGSMGFAKLSVDLHHQV